MATASQKIGVLLVNLGSPDAPNTSDVRRYLREFLMDPRVIDLPSLGRWLLVHAIILPTRPSKSAEAYQKVWTDEGSPLIVESAKLAAGVAAKLDENFHVELVMRYGNPSIRSGVDKLQEKGCDRVIIFPLYPQYASATTGSIYEKCMKIYQEMWSMPEIKFIGDFYERTDFVEAFAAVAKSQLADFKQDYLLFSYHGLPEGHLQKEEKTKNYCLKSQNCCDTITDVNRFCYRAQCVASTRAIAKSLGLNESNHGISFQSRLGKAEWIKPYTDKVIPELYEKGVRRLAIMCPAFVADCLETIEEIGMQAKEQWMELGGEDFKMVTSLNAEPLWIEAVTRMVRETAGQ